MKLLAVNFHYYREEKYASGIYPVSNQEFARQIEVLSKQYTFIGQSDLISWINKGEYPEGNYCIITFDDGLKEQMNAFDWLVKQGIPAIFFVVSKPIMEQCVLNVNKLHYIRTKLTDKELTSYISSYYPEKVKNIDLKEASTQYRYDNDEAKMVKYLLNFSLSDKEKRSILDNCFNELVPNEAEFSKALYMDESDLNRLSRAGMLGSHGHAHLPLAKVDYQTAKEDILTSIQYLEQTTQSPIRSFSYPYGSKVAVNENLLSIFKDTHVQFAFTMWRGRNEIAQGINPYLLYRIDTNDAPGGKNYKGE